MAFFPKLTEVRSTLANPEKWLIDMLGGPQSKSGVKVNRDTANNYSVYFAGKRIIANALMQIPLFLYKRRDGGGRDRATGHHLYRITHTMANPNMTAPRFRQTLTGHMVGQGNGYAQIDMAKGGWFKGLYPLLPHKVYTEKSGGKPVWKYRREDGKPDYTFKDWELLHIPAFGYDGVMGHSLLSIARESIGLGLAMEEYGGTFFSNGLRPSGIISYPGAISDETRKKYKKDIDDKHGELGKSHELLFLENGFDYKQLSISPEDSQFLESRTFGILEMARWMNLPPHKLGYMDAERISNIEHRSIEFVQDSIMPWLILWETELSRMLLSEKEQEEYYFEFLVDALLRADSKTRRECHEIDRRNGITSADDWRENENMNPIGGEEGQRRYIPVNWIPADKAGDFYSGKVADQDNKARAVDFRSVPVEVRAVARNRLSANFHGLFADAAQRVVWREVKEIEKLVAKHTGSRAITDLTAALDDFYGGFGDYVSRQLKPVINSYADAIYEASADEVGGDESTDEEKQAWTEGYQRATVLRYTENSLGQLRAIISENDDESDCAAAITGRLTEWEEKRAEKVADRETVDGRSAFAELIFLAGGFDLIWRTQGKSCPYCNMLNGKRVGRTGSFISAGDTVDPGDDDHIPMTITETKRHPQLHRGCDCIIMAG